jgi:hypothetical protein
MATFNAKKQKRMSETQKKEVIDKTKLLQCSNQGFLPVCIAARIETSTSWNQSLKQV